MTNSAWSRTAVLAAAMLFAACSSSSNSVDLSEPKRVLGRDNDVRIDAQIVDSLSSSSVVRVTFEIENLRSEPIAIADLSPDTSYDVDSRTITVNLGSEIPRAGTPVKLIQINPGEKKGFSKGARLYVGDLSPDHLVQPRFVRVKVNYLGDLRPFEKLLAMPETMPLAKSTSNEFFPHWVEHNEAVTTNAVPVSWRQSSSVTAQTRGLAF